MNTKVKKIIYYVIEYLLIICMFLPFIYIHTYLRKNGVKFKYDVAMMIGGVLICILLMWAVGKLLGVDALFRKGTLKPNWVNFVFNFIRIFSLCYANTTSDYTAKYARLGHIDKNRAIQKIYTLWIVALAVIFISALFEEIYNKKRLN